MLRVLKQSLKYAYSTKLNITIKTEFSNIRKKNFNHMTIVSNSFVFEKNDFTEKKNYPINVLFSPLRKITKFYSIPKNVNDLFEYVDVPIKHIKISKIFYCVIKKRLTWLFLMSSVKSVEK